MKVIFLFLAAFTFASGVSLPDEPFAKDVLPLSLVRNVICKQIRDDLGQYALSYLTNDVSHVEQGSLKQIDGAIVLVKQGKFLQIDQNGNKYLTSYVADEHGFHPIGDYIPVGHTKLLRTDV